MTAPQDIMRQFNVSRETFDRLSTYERLMAKWNPRINLVSRNSLPDFWTRHIADSLQVFDCRPEGAHWVDIGSGGGLPGLVAVIAARDAAPQMRFTLVESDQRKCAFLRTVLRETGCQATVLSQRVEDLAPMATDILSARALADLDQLLSFATPHLIGSGTALFPKGVSWKKEVDNARKQWNFDLDTITSLTEPNAVILKIRGIARV